MDCAVIFEISNLKFEIVLSLLQAAGRIGSSFLQSAIPNPKSQIEMARLKSPRR
jgi:hypothetical protein